MTTVVIYHGGACADGFCAACVLRAALPPGTEFHAANYGEPPPDVAGKAVVIADFSYKRPVMLDLIQQTRGHLTVLDHHKTAQAELAGIEAECYRDTLDQLPTVVFDMTKSGARLAWEWAYDRFKSTPTPFGQWVAARGFFRDRAPWLVDYTEDRDLWRWALPMSREINAALRSYPFDFEVWGRLAGRDCMGLVPEGNTMLRRDQQLIDQHVRHAREVEIGGHKVLAVNATVLMSEIGAELARDRPFGATYFDRSDGLRVWSLRSRDGGVDVSEVAVKLGGGGHARAAGFEASIPGGVA
jgi:uncharacterized protein